MNKSKIFYALYKEKQLRGYLLGSLHSFITEQDYTMVQKAVLPYLTRCKSFIFEVDPQKPYTEITFGIERAIFEVLTKYPDAPRYYLDELSFQYALLSTRIWVGTSIVTLPWHSYTILQKAASMIYILNKVIIFFITRYNIFYNIFTGNKHTIAVQKFQEKQKAIADSLLSHYRSDTMIALAGEDQKHLFLQERHEDWISFICENDFEEPFFITVSAGHLAGEYGLISLFRQKGYELEALPLYKQQ